MYRAIPKCSFRLRSPDETDELSTASGTSASRRLGPSPPPEKLSLRARGGGHALGDEHRNRAPRVLLRRTDPLYC
jgi:hypothetical protein